jgi:hypothetical protein
MQTHNADYGEHERLGVQDDSAWCSLVEKEKCWFWITYVLARYRSGAEVIGWMEFLLVV